MFRFDWPWLGCLLILPAIIYVLSILYTKNKSSNTRQKNKNHLQNNVTTIYFPYVSRIADVFIENKMTSQNESNKCFFTILYLLWISLILSVMKPELVEKIEYDSTNAYNIMLAVDVSQSMYALDFATDEKLITRLDVAKNVISDFVSKRTGDRLGLILFGEHAYLQVPMTFDLNSINKMLHNAEIGIAGPLTAIGDAIAVGIKDIRMKDTKSKIMILLTDGEDTSSIIPPIEAAKIAKHYEIRIYVIAIGNNGLVPFLNPLGGISTIKSKIDEKLLQDIAHMTDGQYFKATDTQALHKIYNHISQLETNEIHDIAHKIQKPLYRYPLFCSCILFLMLCMMPLYRQYRCY